MVGGVLVGGCGAIDPVLGMTDAVCCGVLNAPLVPTGRGCEVETELAPSVAEVVDSGVVFVLFVLLTGCVVEIDWLL